MNIFKNKEINPYNVGDKFKMPVELMEITKEENRIHYKVKPCFPGASYIYGITLDTLNKMEVVK